MFENNNNLDNNFDRLNPNNRFVHKLVGDCSKKNITHFGFSVITSGEMSIESGSDSSSFDPKTQPHRRYRSIHRDTLRIARNRDGRILYMYIYIIYVFIKGRSLGLYQRKLTADGSHFIYIYI